MLASAGMVDQQSYLRIVYSNAMSIERWWKANVDPSDDIYQIIGTISPFTENKLIELGAHPSSGRFDKTWQAINQQFIGWGEVPNYWLEEWEKAFEPYKSQAKGFIENPADIALNKIENATSKAARWLFWAGLIAYFANDAYKETKSSIKGRVSRS
jgi:hypothetical protein